MSKNSSLIDILNFPKEQWKHNVEENGDVSVEEMFQYLMSFWGNLSSENQDLLVKF